MFIVLSVVSKDVVELWEAVVTFLMFPLVVILAFLVIKLFQNGNIKSKRFDYFNPCCFSSKGGEEVFHVENGYGGGRRTTNPM